MIRGGAGVIPEAMKLIASDPDDTVRKRVIAGVSRLPDNAGIAPLIALVRTSQNAVVRKEAVNALSQSKDPRAVALLEEILKR